MAITQATDKASINWQSFNIGSAASVNIAQPSAGSVLLNRVVGNDPSQILGRLSANGQVILLNPNGVVFAKDGSVTASSFTASTFALSDTDFTSGVYKYNRNGSTASVVNQGTIETTAGGFVALIGATVKNEGTIHAPLGDVTLIAAESVTVSTDLAKLQAPAAPSTVSVRMSKRVRLEIDPAAVNTVVENTKSGVIVTDGGQVLLQAAALNSALAGVTHSGVIDTSAAQAGGVTVQADNGVIKVDGIIKANSTAGNKGGDVVIGRDEKTGALAKSTDVGGAILESQGGFVETSGEELKFSDIRVTAKDWLLDPQNITIDGTNNATIGTNLGTTNITLQTTGASLGTASAGTGMITISNAITKAAASGADTTLTLIADNGITVNAPIGTDAGAGKLNIVMTANGQTDGVAVGAMTAGQRAASQGIFINSTSINANGGDVTLTGTSYANGTTQNSGLGKGVQLHNSSSIIAKNITITGTAENQATDTSYGVDFQRNPSAQVLTATGDITITGTLNGLGSGSGVLMGNSGWGGQAPMITAGGQFSLRANNRASASNSSAALDVLSGMQVKAIGDILLQAETNNAAANAIRFTSGAASPNAWGNALSGNTSLRSIDANGNASGNVLIQANQGSIGINNLLDPTLTSGSLTALTQIKGKNVTIDNTGAGMLTGVNNTVGSGSLTLDATSGNVSIVAGAGKSTVNQGVLINDARAIDATNNLNIAGASTSSLGIQSNAVLTGGSINLTGKSNSNNGVYLATSALTSTSGDVSITGTSGSSSAMSLQAAITSNQNVVISGSNTTSPNANAAIYLNKAVTATNGTISITAETSGSTVQALQLASGSSLTTTNKSITLTTDSLNLDTTAAAVNAGTSNVTIQNKRVGVQIAIGGSDVGSDTATSRTLGLTNAELNRITAGNLTVGSSNAGGVVVSAATTTLATSGNLFLTSGGNITLSSSLTVGDVGATKNLTLNGAGATSAITQAAAIKSAGLELLGANAAHTLTNAGNDVKKLAGNTKSISLTNNANLNIDTVNTVGMTTSGNTTLSSSAAVTQSQAISASSLELLGVNGSYTLANAANATSTLASNTGSLSYINASALDIGSVNTTDGIAATGNVYVKTVSGNLSLSKDISTSGTTSLDAAAALTRIAGTITAGTLNLKAGSGIGTSGSRIQTNVDYLSLDSRADQFVTEATAVTVASQTSANNASIDISTTNGTLSVGSVNSIAGMTTNGSGRINLAGNSSSNANGISVVAALTAGGDITLTGTSATGIGTLIGGNIAGGNAVTVQGTSNTKHGVNIQNAISADGPISITGTSGDGSDLGVIIWQGANITANASVNNFNGTDAISIRGLTPTNATNTGRNVVINNATITNNSTNGNTYIYGQNSEISLDSGAVITNASTSGKITVFADNNAKINTALSSGGAPVANVVQNSNAGIDLISNGNGDVIVPVVSNHGTGDVVIAAGSTIAAGTGAGGQVLTRPGNAVTNTSGKTYIYSGQASSTGVLSNLSNSFNALYYEGTSHAINTAFNKAFDGTPANDLTASAGGSVATDAQVFFRSNTKPSFTLTLNDLNKHYGDTDPTNFVATGGATLLSNAYAGSGGSNNFVVAATDVIAALSGTRSAGENVGAYAYMLDGSSMNTTLAAQPNLNIARRDITLVSVTAADKQYDASTTATVNGGVFDNLANGETLSLSGLGLFANPNVSVGKTISVPDVTALTKVDGTGSWSNYNLTTNGAVNGVGTITQAPLTLTVNNSAVFVTQSANSAPDNGFSYSGFINGDTPSVFNSIPTRIYTGAASYPVAGTYNGTLSTSAVPISTNYLVSVVPGNLTVTPADKLLITIGSQSAQYGSQTAASAGSAAIGSVTAKYCFVSNNCNSPNLVDLTLTQLSALQWKASDNTGSYVVFDTSVIGAQASSSGYLKVGNYTYTASEIAPLSLPNVNFNGRATNAGVLTITPLPVALTSTTLSKTYDGTTALPVSAQPTSTLTADNKLNGDVLNASFISGNYASSAASSSASFNLFGVQLFGSDASNYSLVNYTNNTFTGTGKITSENNNSQSNAGKPFIVNPPQPIIPASSASSGGKSGGGISLVNPYLAIPTKNPNDADGCTANSLEDCLCEALEPSTIDGLSLCYQPKKTVRTPRSAKAGKG